MLLLLIAFNLRSASAHRSFNAFVLPADLLIANAEFARPDATVIADAVRALEGGITAVDQRLNGCDHALAPRPPVTRANYESIYREHLAEFGRALRRYREALATRDAAALHANLVAARAHYRDVARRAHRALRADCPRPPPGVNRLLP